MAGPGGLIAGPARRARPLARPGKDEAKSRLNAAQERLLALRLALGGKLAGEDGPLGPPVVVVFEGWDASGKGGALKRLVEPLDPRHVRVAQFAAPDPDEKRHHFLWRFWPTLPGWGGMTVFDRSWYGRVLVERVEGFATPEEWERAYDEIVDLERIARATRGCILIKFWLHVSDEEQLKRFKKREKDPLKSWKLTAGRLAQPREARGSTTLAVEDMLARTEPRRSRAGSSWRRDSKRYARVKVVETVVSEIEKGCEARGFPSCRELPVH